MLKRINEALPRLIAGILGYGVIVQFVGMWFTEDWIGYTIGLWFGIAVAVGMAINLAKTILDAVDLGAEPSKWFAVRSGLRYAVVVLLFFIFGYVGVGSILAAFLGVMGLKISAYLQPLLEKIGNSRKESL